MKKFYILLFLGIQGLAAPEAVSEEAPAITLKITPSVEAKGSFNFAGKEQSRGEAFVTDGDAEGRVKAEVDYKGIAGVVVELEGDFNKAEENTVTLGFGDDAYAYGHVLELFGLDEKVFDLYLKGGRFELGFQNAMYAGDDDWLVDIDPIGRDQRINMQLDLKILDMIIVRYGQGFAPFDAGRYGHDLGFGILFEKVFGIHRIMASVAYVLDSSNNQAGNDVTRLTSALNDASDVSKSENAVRKVVKDFDQLGVSVAYEASLGQIVLMPFINVRIAGLLNKPKRLAYQNGQVAWSGGVKFAFRNAGYDIIGAGLDLDGMLNRANNNYYSQDIRASEEGTLVRPKDTRLNMGFRGFQVKLWSDALRSIMGDNYLKLWAKVRFETWLPDKNLFGLPTGDAERTSIFKKLSVGLEQYLVKEDKARVSVFAEFYLENIVPFAKKGNTRWDYSSDDGFTVSKTNVKVFWDLGLRASFTAVFLHK